MSLDQVKGLYDLGFAVHLLHPKSKRPIEAKWTSGPRKTWKELRASYRKGMNLGVRLGTPSELQGGFLAVVDCDVKSSAPESQIEMLEKLESLLAPSVHSVAGTVASGRGNGSQHVYVLTKEPAAPRRLAQSADKVRVKMPSAKPSGFEKRTMSEKDLAAGWRIRPAWEISIMGEGQQVVLPPSIHPDSGKPYRWFREIKGSENLPTLATNGIAERKREAVEDFKAVEVDLVGSKLPDRIVDLILSGEGCDDRSAGLFSAAIAMVKAGFKDNEILSVLTDRDTYLGEAAYEHTGSDSRKRAAAWVREYTLGKAKRETLAKYQFDAEVDERELSDEEAKAQAEEVESSVDWRALIERGSEKDGARPKSSLANVILILKGEFGKDVFKKDLFGGIQLHARACPWGAKAGEEVNDEHVTRIKVWLADHYRFEPATDKINEAITTIAAENGYHPVRDYLDALKWDGKPRLDTWLKDYLEAEAPEPYLSAVSRKVLCAMIARVYEPGKKFDQVLILQGHQGKGKSTVLRNLASDLWFTDSEINVSDKDAVMTMRSKWLIELGELSGMRSADVELLKAFVSRTEDRIRVPYGKRAENFPRQCIFIGTTNRDEFLKDPTGNRRYWPVKVGECDFDGVKRVRDQLFAEAKFAYEMGEPLWLEERDAQKIAGEEQEARTFRDSLSEKIEAFFAQLKAQPEEERQFDPEKFTMSEAFSDVGPLAHMKDHRQEQLRAGEAFRALGYDKVTVRGADKVLRKYWMKR